MKKVSLLLRSFLCIVIFSVSMQVRGNNIAVSNVQLVNKNTSAGPNSLENFAMVQFNLSWENAWRTSTGPSNWDAAWVFVKYRVGRTDLTLTNGVSAGTTITVASTAGLRIGMPVEVTSGVGSFGIGSVVKEILSGTQFVVDRTPEYPLNGGTITAKRIWEHATLSSDPTQHSLGSFTIGGANTTGAFTGVPDGTGVFVHLGQDGSGNIAAGNVQLRWRYGANGLVDSNVVDLKVFAVEMVYVPQGSFYVGSGGEEAGSLTNGVWTSGKTSPFRINSENPIQVGSTNGKLWATFFPSQIINQNFVGDTSDIPISFPKGYDSFYCMKYEMSQSQYVDLLNTLTFEQQIERIRIPPNSTPKTGYNLNRNSIQVKKTGVFRLSPAEFACNENLADSIFNSPLDGLHVPIHMNWNDMCAYLDWSGLRPMTELEYEKACRANQPPIANEFAWGTSFIRHVSNNLNSMAYTIANRGQVTESIASGFSDSLDIGNAYYGHRASYPPDYWGPLRQGIFASNILNQGNDRERRIKSGATYYGIMEMTGNLNEQTINLEYRNFKNQHGDGMLTFSGNANVSSWPGNSNGEIVLNSNKEIIFKGGGWDGGPTRVSDRSNRFTDSRFGGFVRYSGGPAGVRGVRSLK
jgi:formylglycine-generating enzyme required for sulfatase activity